MRDLILVGMVIGFGAFEWWGHRMERRLERGARGDKSTSRDGAYVARGDDVSADRRSYEVVIDRYALWRVLDMPGLTRIDMQDKAAALTFTTAPGCEPAGLEFVARQVQHISGGHVLRAREETT